MARPAPVVKKSAGTPRMPSPPPKPTKKQIADQKIPCMPMDFKLAAAEVGLHKLITGKGPGRSGNNTKYRALIKQLEGRQHYLSILMRGKHVFVRRAATLKEFEDAYMPGNDGNFRVELIINSAKHSKKLTYQVVWENFPIEFASWEPAGSLKLCKHLVKAFHNDFKHKPGQPIGSNHEVLGNLDAEVPDVVSDDETEDDGDSAAADAERPLPPGGLDALNMKLLPPPKKRIPGIAPSTRDMPDRTRVSVYENLNDRALSSGKVKAKFNADGEDRNIGTPTRNNRKSRGDRAKQSAVGGFTDSDREEWQMESSARRSSAKHPRRDKQVIILSDSEDEDDEPAPVRKKSKKVAAKASEDDGDLNDFLNEALETVASGEDEDQDEDQAEDQEEYNQEMEDFFNAAANNDDNDSEISVEL